MFIFKEITNYKNITEKMKLMLRNAGSGFVYLPYREDCAAFLLPSLGQYFDVTIVVIHAVLRIAIENWTMQCFFVFMCKKTQRSKMWR